MRRSRLDALILEQEGIAPTSRAEIEAMQLKKLNALLQREHHRQGFYRDLPDPKGKVSILDADRKEGLKWICSTVSWS